MDTLFWLAMAVLSLTWVGYPVALYLLQGLFPREPAPKDYFPTVTVMVTVHNEEKVIARRLQNLLSLDYPKDRLDILVVSDGSTDGTEAILRDLQRRHPAIRFLATPKLGKSGAQNLGVPLARGEIIVFTDAETLFAEDTVKMLVRHFADPRVGCVSGRLVLGGQDGAVSCGHGLYWRYEMWLRRQESRLGLLHTSSGVALAFRKSLFRPLSPSHGDDCAVPLDVILQGQRVIHEEEALAYDAFPNSLEGELRARIRMTLRNLICTLAKYPVLNPFRFPGISLAILYHKLCRWLTPYFIMLIFLTNLLLLHERGLYQLTFFLQMGLIFLGLIGFVAAKNNKKIPLATQIFNFSLANVGFFLGVFRAVCGEKIISYRNRDA